MSLLSNRVKIEKRVYWGKQIQAWEVSGLTQKEFCEQNKLKLGSFVKWRQRLRKEVNNKSETASPHLIPVSIKSVVGEPPQPRHVIGIELGQDKRIELPLTISAKQLQIIFSCLRFCDD